MQSTGLIYYIRYRYANDSWYDPDHTIDDIYLTPENAIHRLHKSHDYPILFNCSFEDFYEGKEPGLCDFSDLNKIREYYYKYFSYEQEQQIYLFEKQKIIDTMNSCLKQKKHISFYKNLLQLDDLYIENGIFMLTKPLKSTNNGVTTWIDASASADQDYIINSNKG